MAQAVRDCTARGTPANDSLIIALDTADFCDAIAECVSICGNPAMEFPCLEMIVNAATWEPPLPARSVQGIVQQPVDTRRSQVVLPGRVTMPTQRGAVPGTYYVPTPHGPRWFSVAPLP